MRGALTSDYDFDLPAELICSVSAREARCESRLMVLDRASRLHLSSVVLRSLPELLAPRDLFVVNRSKVVKARLLGTRVGSGAPAEIFLLSPLGDGRYEAMVSPGGKLKPGRVVDIAPGFTVEIVSVTERRGANRTVARRTRHRSSDRSARAHPVAALHRARR